MEGRAHDGLAVRIVPAHAADEGLVDLQGADREALEVSQRGVAGTEVVHRQLEAEVAQARAHAEDPLGVRHDHALGDLQLERVGLEVGAPVDESAQVGRQVRVDQIPHREVHRDGHVEAVSRKIGTQCAPDLGLVVDDQDSRTAVHGRSPIGSVTQNVAPPPGVRLNSSRPP